MLSHRIIIFCSTYQFIHRYLTMLHALKINVCLLNLLSPTPLCTLLAFYFLPYSRSGLTKTKINQAIKPVCIVWFESCQPSSAARHHHSRRARHSLNILEFSFVFTALHTQYTHTVNGILAKYKLLIVRGGMKGG